MIMKPSSRLYVDSQAFDHNQSIPVKHTCDGEDVSPPLSWKEEVGGIRSYAVVVDDPDAPGRTFTHWVLFNLPPDSRSLPENIPKQATLDNGAVHGKNDFGKMGYGGPCPPSGKPHRYRFHVYALDKMLDLQPGTSKDSLLKAMEGHILADSEITGMYGR